MNPLQNVQPYAYALVILGLGLAAWSAVAPHYDAGYRLHGAVLVALALPFVAYASLTQSLRPGWLLAAGIALVAVTIHTGLRIAGAEARTLEEPATYGLPALVALILLPAAYLLGRRQEP